MDNVTHALAGLLLAEATVALVGRRRAEPPGAGLRRTAAVIGVVGAELPDADLLYAGPILDLMDMGRLGYLLHHRGHTHTIVFALAGALVLWGIALLARRGRPAAERWALLGLALVATLSHVALDWTNSYGVHPFWPVANGWYYGDAVFIVEPWLWIAAIPPLLLVARSRTLRLLLAVALGGILVAAWRTGQVEPSVALALTLGAAAWLAVVGLAPRARRVALGLGAWLALEAVFFGASRLAERTVRAAVGPATLRDAVLTPAVGDPRCVRALVVELDGGTYRVTRATVAPFPALREASACPASGDGLADGTTASSRAATPRLRWGGEWSAPGAELAALARDDCEIAAALRFIRVPRWRRLPGGAVQLWDARYGAGGFAQVVTPSGPGPCPSPVPPWEPPRGDVIGEAAAELARGREPRRRHREHETTIAAPRVARSARGGSFMR
jgi:inner membrane protein